MLYPDEDLYPNPDLYPGGGVAVSVLGDRLRERTAPLAPDDADYDYAHAKLCEAIMVMFAQVGDVWDPPDPAPPGAPLLDPELTPDWALPWTAQLVGVRLPAGATPDQARALIIGTSAWQRGTPAAIKLAAALFLTNTRTVFFRERDAGDPYALEVVTLASETPDPAQVEAAILTQKPAGIVLRYRALAGAWDYEQMTIGGGTYAEQSAAYASYAHLALDQEV
jgi:hypothetical protein